MANRFNHIKLNEAPEPMVGGGFGRTAHDLYRFLGSTPAQMLGRGPSWERNTLLGKNRDIMRDKSILDSELIPHINQHKTLSDLLAAHNAPNELSSIADPALQNIKRNVYQTELDAAKQKYAEHVSNFTNANLINNDYNTLNAILGINDPVSFLNTNPMAGEILKGMAEKHAPDVFKSITDKGGAISQDDFKNAQDAITDKYHKYVVKDNGNGGVIAPGALPELQSLSSRISTLEKILNNETLLTEPGQKTLRSVLASTPTGEDLANQREPITPEQVTAHIQTLDKVIPGLRSQINILDSEKKANDDIIQGYGEKMVQSPSRFKSIRNILGTGALVTGGVSAAYYAGQPDSPQSQNYAAATADVMKEKNKALQAKKDAESNSAASVATDKAENIVDKIYNYAKQNPLYTAAAGTLAGLGGIALAAHLADGVYGSNDDLSQKCKMIQDPTQRAECEKSVINKISTDLQASLSNCDGDDCKDQIHSYLAKNQAQLMDPSVVTESSILNRINSKKKFNEGLDPLSTLGLASSLIYGVKALKDYVVDPIVDPIANKYNQSVWESEGCAAIEDSTEQLRCKLYILSKSATELNNQLDLCNNTSNPDICKEKINLELEKISKQKEMAMSKFRTITSGI